METTFDYDNGLGFSEVRHEGNIYFAGKGWGIWLLFGEEIPRITVILGDHHFTVRI